MNSIIEELLKKVQTYASMCRVPSYEQSWLGLIEVSRCSHIISVILRLKEKIPNLWNQSDETQARTSDPLQCKLSKQAKSSGCLASKAHLDSLR